MKTELINVEIKENEVVTGLQVGEDGVIFVNLTPHEISYYNNGEKIFSVPAADVKPLRLSEENTVKQVVEGMEIVSKTYSSPAEEMPDKLDNVYYIVSQMVLNAADRSDFIAPDTGSGAVREEGRILGTTRWVQK